MSTIVIPTSINVGQIAMVNVNLNNIPVGGYSSAEFTCTYNPTLVEVSNIVVTNLFGADAVAAINGPQNGSFIVAIAGSNGNRATVDGTAFTFNAKGLQAGQTAIECTARISKGDNILDQYSVHRCGKPDHWKCAHGNADACANVHSHAFTCACDHWTGPCQQASHHSFVQCG